VTLHHHRRDIATARSNLRAEIRSHLGLLTVILTTVPMATVHHELPLQAAGLKALCGLADELRRIVRPLGRTTQNDVTGIVAFRPHDRADALFGDREKVMRPSRRANPVDGDLHAAASAVLKAHRHRKPRGQLAVHLALRRARADRSPSDQIGDKLRADRVEKFGSRRNSKLCQIDEQPPRRAQPFVDVERAVEMRIVDQPLPTHGSARLFEIDTHQN